MAKLSPSLKITLTIIAIILAIGAIATPIILLISANSDTNSTPVDNTNQNPSTTNSATDQNPSNNPTDQDDNSDKALAQAQIARRDHQRRQDIARLKSVITLFQSNNNGKLPGQGSNLDGQDELVYQPSKDHTLPSASDGVAARLIAYYLNPASTSENDFIDPDGWTYGLTIIDYDHYKNLPEKTAEHMIYLLHQTSCNPDTGITRSDKPRDFAILYRLESGSLYCLDSQ